MEKVSIDDVERWDHPVPGTPGPHRLGDALGATDVAVNYYELAPDEGLSGGPHTHMDQEELFVVLEGTVSFDVAEGPDLSLGPDEAVRFAPGEVQHGYNDGRDTARVVALGAPADSEEIRSPGPCPACGAEDVLLEVAVYDDGSGLEIDCPACGETVTL